MENNKSILVSVITINKNNSEGLLQTINSILKQENVNVEWIFVDGASSDNSLEVASSVNISKKIISEPDQGIYDAMNKGIHLLSEKSELSIFLNSGDYFYNENSLANIINCYSSRNPRPNVIFCGTVELTRFGNRTKHPKTQCYIYYGMPCHHQSVVYKTETLRKYRFDQKFKLASDYAQISKILMDKNIIFRAGQILSVFANDGVSILNSEKSRAEATIVRSEILRVPYLINICIFYIHSLIHKIKLNIGYFNK